MYIHKKLSPKWKNCHEQKVFLFRFYILCENFSEIRPIIKKIPKFSDDPLKAVATIRGTGKIKTYKDIHNGYYYMRRMV